MTRQSNLTRHPDLPDAINACRRCPLYRTATQGVAGEGPRRASLMLVGEQPGSEEDFAGRPFVGPAGRLLDKALADAGIDRMRAFVTNAVKHFKFEPRGKRRLHKRPNVGEIEACRWWLDLERQRVQPKLVVAMGGTAARSLFGRTVTIAEARGRATPLPDGAMVLVTVHPSLLLRIRDSRDRADAYGRFVKDLLTAREFTQGA